jgi:hypothetical protein
MTIRGVEGSNVLTYVDDENKPYKWDETDLGSPKTGAYNLSSLHLTDASLVQLKSQTRSEGSYTYINGKLNGRLYLLPQKLTSSAEIELAVSVFLGEELVSILPPFIFKLPAGSVWEEEKIVSYMMSLDLQNVKQSAIDVKVQGWNDSGNSHSSEMLE